MDTYKNHPRKLINFTLSFDCAGLLLRFQVAGYMQLVEQLGSSFGFNESSQGDAHSNQGKSLALRS